MRSLSGKVIFWREKDFLKVALAFKICCRFGLNLFSSRKRLCPQYFRKCDSFSTIFLYKSSVLPRKIKRSTSPVYVLKAAVFKFSPKVLFVHIRFLDSHNLTSSNLLYGALLLHILLGGQKNIVHYKCILHSTSDH